MSGFDVWSRRVPASACQVRLVIMFLIMPADLFSAGIFFFRCVALNNVVLCNYQTKKGQRK